MKTMHETYGDSSNHKCCSKCGMCLTCKDCICTIDLDETLEQQFPKGKCKERGHALVLYAIAKIKIDELQKAFDIAIEEINNLRAKRKYWETRFKKCGEKK